MAEISDSRGKTPLMVFAALLLTILVMRGPITCVGAVADEIISVLDIGYPAYGFLSALPIACFGLFCAAAPAMSKKYGLIGTLFISLTLLFVGAIGRLLPIYSTMLVATGLIGVGIALLNVRDGCFHGLYRFFRFHRRLLLRSPTSCFWNAQRPLGTLGHHGRCGAIELACGAGTAKNHSFGRRVRLEDVEEAHDLGGDFCDGHAVPHHLHNGGVASDDFIDAWIFCLNRGAGLCCFSPGERSCEYSHGSFY